MNNQPKTINSDTVKPEPSPIPPGVEFTVRSITRGWSATFGHEEWQLVQQSSTNQTLDKRLVAIDEKSDLFKEIVAADPRVLTLERGFSRDLLPPYKVGVKEGQSRYCKLERYNAMKISTAETKRKADRVHFDELDDLRKELGLGYAESNNIIRKLLNSGDDWYERCATAIREKAAATAASKGKPGELDVWFPRDEEQKPVDDPKTDELMTSLEKLTSQDELTKPTWSAIAAKDIEGQRIAAFKHFSREISSRDNPANVNQHLLKALGGIPLEQCIKQNGIQTTVDYLQLYIENFTEMEDTERHFKNTASNASEDTPPAIGVHEMQYEAPSAQKSAEKPAPISQLPEAPFSANFKLVHKSGVEIQFTIRAASGAEGIPQIDKAIDYLLSSGYTTRQQAAQSLPPNATPIGDAPSAQQNNSGKSPCMMIKVARSFTGNKPQLEFEVDGFENPIRFTSDNPGKLAAALKGIRKPDGSEFTAADMTDGRKFGGNWMLSWEKKQKDDKTYTNFVAIA